MSNEQYNKMKDRVLKLLIKRGWNEQDSIKMIEDNLSTAMRCYPEAKASYLAEVVTY